MKKEPRFGGCTLPPVVRLVLAGTLGQAYQYAKKNGWEPQDWKAVSSVESIMGIHNAELHMVGTYYERADIYEVNRQLDVMSRTGTVSIIEPNPQPLASRALARVGLHGVVLGNNQGVEK